MFNKRDFNSVLKCINNNPEGIELIKKDFSFFNKLNLFLPNLIPPSNRPDAYAIYYDSILLLEHFQFDNSKIVSGGSKQKITSAETERILEKNLESNKSFAVVEEMVVKNGKFYIENFQKQFNNHAQKIEHYKVEIQKELNKKFESFLVGFVIEDSSPLGSCYYNNGMCCVNLIKSKEFLDLFESTPNLDFVIFAMTGNINNKPLSFISRNTINDYRKEQFEISKIERFLFQKSFCAGGMIEI